MVNRLVRQSGARNRQARQRLEELRSKSHAACDDYPSFASVLQVQGMDSPEVQSPELDRKEDHLTDPDEWFTKVPTFLRQSANPIEKYKYLERICEIVSRIEATMHSTFGIQW
jgi:hypothetical protein